MLRTEAADSGSNIYIIGVQLSWMKLHIAFCIWISVTVEVHIHLEGAGRALMPASMDSLDMNSI